MEEGCISQRNKTDTQTGGEFGPLAALPLAPQVFFKHPIPHGIVRCAHCAWIGTELE
jgi:hypothetical protein